MTAASRLLAACAILSLCGCGAPYGNEDDDGWRPLRANSPAFSYDGALNRERMPSKYGSSLTVPRVIGAAPPPLLLQEEDGNVWPGPEKARTTLTDPDAVARGVPNFQPEGRPPQPAPRGDPQRGSTPPPGSRPVEITRRPDGSPAVTGPGAEGVWTYGTPGRPGVGTAFPDGRGGRVLVEPGGGTVIAPR